MRSVLESFLDGCQDDLAKPKMLVSLEHMRSVWEQSVKSGGLGDEFSLVEVFLSSSRLNDQLKIIFGSKERGETVDTKTEAAGIEFVSARVVFSYPDTIMFTNEIQAKYDLIFRFSFRLLTLARSLSNHRFHGKPTSDSKRLDILKCQMLNFVSVVHQYLIFDVLLSNWDQFVNTVASASEVIHIVEKHSEFLDSCLRLAGLTNPRLIERYDSILSHIQQFVANPASLESKLDDYQREFNDLIRGFLEALEYFSSRDYDYHLSILFGRLDHNSYYYSSGFGVKNIIG